MPCYSLQPRSRRDGSFAPAWFDDAQCLWDDPRLYHAQRLSGEWQVPQLAMHRPVRGPTPVLFNPDALAFSEGLRDELASFAELEFLPISIDDHGTFFILNVVAAIELPSGSDAKFATTPGGNLIWLNAFPQGFAPPNGFFHVRQPEGTTARRGGWTTREIYMGEAAAARIEELASDWLECKPVPVV